MKRFYLVTIICLLFTVKIIANPIDSAKAKTVAQNFYALNSAKVINTITLAYTESAADGTVAYYVFNINDNDGWVMVCADDAATPILGYNTTGHFGTKNMSPEFSFWKGGYKQQIDVIKQKHLQPTPEINNQWNKYNQLQRGSITTMGYGLTPTQPAFHILQTTWSQSPGYNIFCPQDNTIPVDKCPNCNGFATTGCVATAMAQILKKWNYPSILTNNIPTYHTSTKNYVIVQINTNQVSFNYDKMPLNISSNDIAQLMYVCGASVQMDYNKDGGGSSGAWCSINDALQSNNPKQTSSAEYALKTYFNYNSSTLKSVYRNNMSSNDWSTTLKNELDNGRPILYCASGSFNNEQSGHAWVCEGHDFNNLFYMNWGWGGYFNGYYNVEALNFSDIQNDISITTNTEEALIGIQPNCLSADLQFAVLPTVSNTNPKVGDQVTVYCQEYNAGSSSAGNNAVNVYLSTSETFTFNGTGQTYLGTISFPRLASGASSNVLSTTVTIPSGFSNNCYLHFWADASNTDPNGVVGECREDNNYAHIPITITPTSNTCSAPSNDNSCNAVSLTINGNAVNGTTCGATGDPTFTSYANVKDVFYKITPSTSNITVTVSPSSGNSFYPAFQLLSSTSCSALNAVNSIAVTSSGSGQSASQFFQVISGSDYYIRVWDNGTSDGNFLISVSGTSCITPGKAYNLTPGSSSAPGQVIINTTPHLSWAAPGGANTYIGYISRGPVYGADNLVNSAGFKTTNNYLDVPAGYLANGNNYRWNVFAYPSDGASCYSVSDVAYFSVNTGTACAPPTTQSSNISFGGINTNSVTVNWNVGNGDRHIVKINTTGTFSDITNGTTSTPNSVYSGSGEQIVYDGSSSYITVSGLSTNTTYYFKVYDANCSGTMAMYNNSTATNNPLSVTTAASTTPTCIAPTTPASNVSFSNVGTNSMTVNWTNGNGSKRIVKMFTAYTFTMPSNGVDPSYNNYWTNSGAEQVIYNGTGNSITVTGLSANTQYWFKVYEANCSGSSIVYNNTATNNNAGSQYTATACTPPPVPTPSTGNAQCTNSYLYSIEYGSNGSVWLGWNSTYGSAMYDVEVREYPYGDNNIVYTRSCINDYSDYVPMTVFSPGKLYAYRVRATTDCQSCYSAWSALSYFGIYPTINSLDSNVTICNGKGMTLSIPTINVPSPGTVTCLWYQERFNNNQRSDVLVGTGNTFYADSAHSGYTYVKLVYSGSTVCSGNDTTIQSLAYFVTISNTPQPPVLTSNSPICQSNSLTLSATSTSSAYITSYVWSGPNNFSSGNNSITNNAVDTINAGTYSCYVVTRDNSISSGCPSAIATIKVVVNPAPVASYTYTVSGNTVTFTNTSTNATTYSWNFGDGQTSTQQSPTHTYTNAGNYTACVTVNNTNNCNASSYCQSIAIGGTTQTNTLPTFAKMYTDGIAGHSFSMFRNSVVQSKVDSGYIGVGLYQITGSGAANYIVYFKTDKNGKFLWARQLAPGNINQNFPQIITSQNGYLINYNYINNNYAQALIEIDEQGNKLWSTQNSGFAGLGQITKATDGYIGINSSSSNGILITKLDFTGALLWQKSWNYSLFGNYTSMSPVNITIDGSNNIFVMGKVYDDTAIAGGFTTSKSFIAKFDMNGNHLWSETYDGGTSATNISNGLIDNNSNLIIDGWILNYTTGVGNNFICKLNPSSGSLVSAYQNQNNAITLINASGNNYNCLIGYNLVNLNSGFSINNLKSINLSSKNDYYNLIPTLDNKITITTDQYLPGMSSGDGRFAIDKYSFTDASCLDNANTATISLSPFTMSFASQTPTAGATNFQTTSLAINPTIITLKDSDICHNCNLTPTITPSGVTTFCKGGNVTLSANAGMSSYLWSNGATTPSINVNSTGSYTVAITDSYGCSATSSSISVTNNTPVTPTITSKNNVSFCQGGIDTLVSNATTGNQWYLNGVAIPNATVTTYFAATSGIYVATSTANGCMSDTSNKIIVTVNTLPVTPTISNNRPLTFCSGDSTILTSSASSGNQWYLNGSAINGVTNANYTANANGSYTVIVTNSNGCTATSTAVNVTVNTLPTAPTISNNRSLTFCSGDSTILTSSASSGNQWYNGNSILTGSTGINYSAKSNGSYTVVTTNSNGCNSLPAKDVIVTVNDLPANPTISWNGNQLSTVSGMSSYLWYNGSTAVPGVTSNTLTPTSAGNYTVTVTNAVGCSATSTAYTLVVTAVNTPNINGNEIKVFPNPAQNQVYVQFSKFLTNKAQIRLLDAGGKILQTIITQEQTNIIPLQNCVQGVYFIEIADGNNKETIKLLIAK